MKTAAYALLVYLLFLATFVYFMGFVEGAFVPRAVDSPARASVVVSLLVDCGWFVFFAVQHSAMARPSFKRWWTRFVPSGGERSTYVLASSVMLLLLFAVWQPIPVTLWRVPEGIASHALTGVSLGGWGLALAATYAIDHFELFGLRQAFEKKRGVDPRHPVLQTPALYRLVRHPLYLGFVIAFWVTPHMTAGHAIFALGMTLYVLIGVHFEERDLVRNFGESYLRYRDEVPMLLPWPRPRRLAEPTTIAPSR